MKLLTELDSLDNVKDGETRILPTKVSQLQNDSGYITGITSGDVTTALGYNPEEEANIYQLSRIRQITSTDDEIYIYLTNDMTNGTPIIINTGTGGCKVIGTRTTLSGSRSLWFMTSDNSYGKITFTVSGTSVTVTIEDIDIPTATSDLTNDSNFAVTNANNNFSSSQSITGDLTVSGTAQIQNGLYCKPTGQVNTPVGNSMLVIKRATNSEAPNNGVVLEFGNSTSWTGQLFIGDNATQGIYYNGWSNGVRGSWIKLASQNDLAKNIITMQLTGTQSFSNAYTKLNLSAGTTIGTKLSVSSNQVKIGSGVNHIKVSATLGYNYKTAGLRYLRITKNWNASNIDGTTIAMQLNYETTANHTGTLAITDIVISVSENDLIGMYVYGLSGDSARQTTNGMLQTNMTIEVID